MDMNQIWNCETDVAALLDISQPDWLAYDLTVANIAAICQGGCASGVYMPAVTYTQATDTMSRHGNDVLAYIEDNLGELPAPPKGESWQGMACFYLSYAVEIWAHDVMAQLEELELEGIDA